MNHKAIWVLMLLAGCRGDLAHPGAGKPRPSGAAPKRQAADVIFGAYDKTNRFLRIRELVLSEGKRFGWRIHLPCRQAIEFVETLTLPMPGDWTQIKEARESDPHFLIETTISSDGKQTVTHDYAPCIDGWIEHTWQVAESDPPGEWVIKVEIDGYQPFEQRLMFVKR